MLTRRLIGLTTMFSLLLAGLAVQAQGQEVQVSNAWARRAPMAHGGSMGKEGMGKEGMDKGAMDKAAMGGGNGAVYVTLKNPGAQPLSLVSASTDAAKMVELHETTKDGAVMKMRPVASIAIPAGGTVEMKPGGYHIMLLGLTRDLAPGDKVAVTLKFDRGPEVRVDAPVK